MSIGDPPPYGSCACNQGTDALNINDPAILASIAVNLERIANILIYKFAPSGESAWWYNKNPDGSLK